MHSMGRLFLMVLLFVAFKPMEAELEFHVTDNTTNVPNNVFQKEIGLEYYADVLKGATNFVLYTFNQPPEVGKNYSHVLSIVESFFANGISTYDPLAPASTINNRIRINQDYLQQYDGLVKYEFTGILFHESTRVWQWDANGEAPNGLLTGIADYVRLTAGWPSEKWQIRGSGFIWSEGYEVTAYFLEYCTSLRAAFVSEINDRMKYTFGEDIFMQLLGKSVDDLWNDYKSMYEIPPTAAPAPSPTCH